MSWQRFAKMKLPVLRWTGGCFADEYHWMEGIRKGIQKENDQYKLGRRD